MLGLIYFLIALGVVVIIHEAGHLMAAKKNGVYCHEFSIGMGPKIWNFYTDKTGTKYNLRLIPFGGYVMMSGEDDSIVTDKDIPDESKLTTKSVGQRAVIYAAGVFMNILLAFVVCIIVGFIQPEYSTDNTVNVIPEGALSSVYTESTIKVTEVNGILTDSYESVVKEINNSNEDVVLSQNDEDYEISKIDGKVGVGAVEKEKTIIGSLKLGFSTFIGMFVMVFMTLKMLFTGQASIGDLAGPIGIYQMSSDVLTLGLASSLSWIAYLSVSVGILNFLPVPAMDGGRLIFLAYEAIFKKPVNRKFEQYSIAITMILLFALLIFVSVGDVTRLFN